MSETTDHPEQNEPVRSADSLLRPVTPHTVSDQVAEQIRSLIASGEYKPGDRIPSERDLALKLGVGRPAIREALRELKAHGLLASGRGAQGTTVTNRPNPSFSEPMAPLLGQGAERIVELMEVRSAVEIEAAGLAARRATLQDIHRLSTLVADSEGILTPEEDIAFHAAIADATHNPLFERVIQGPVDLLHDHMAAILEAYYEEPGGAVALHQQHDAIRQAIRSGDEVKARQAMRKHLDYVVRGLAQLVGAGRVIRLVFLNVDGTLLSGPRHISERTKRTISDAREGGVEIVLVSSRPPRDIRLFHQQLQLHTPIIACGGALLWNEQARAGLTHVSVEPGLATEVITLGRSLGAIANLESDDEWFTDRLSNLERGAEADYEISDPHGIGTVDEVLRAGEPIDRVFLDLREAGDEKAAFATAAVKRAFGRRATIYESIPGLLNISSLDASKASMAQQLARRMQVPAEQTMALGDDDSDAPLLQWSGVGVAMGNATPTAKAAADVITSSNLRDGVAEALEQHLLGRGVQGGRINVPKRKLVADQLSP